MPDQFLDPTTQARLNKALSALEAKQAELDQLYAESRQAVTQFEGMTREAYATQQAQAREFAGARPVGAATAGEIESASGAARQLAAAEEQVNAAIVRQIELQARAAAAARETAAQSSGILGAAERVQRVAAPDAQAQQIEQAAAEVRAARSAPIINVAAGSRQAQDREAAADATSKLSAQEQRLLASAQAGAAAESQLGAATQRNILISAQSSDVLQRHGAMTTEFIQAAARGQVTLREFGNQMTSTIGKFAGWTVAAAAVYGVIGAVTELGKGAIDGSNAVGQLHRTIDGLSDQQAGQALVTLAHDTNTSMEEAGNAVFLFSRTFHNIDDAVTVARLGLMAFSLDGVALADTVKAATAIHQQFGISAQGLVPVFDELAAGQREFNARMTEQIPLLQRSASAVKNAGGDLHDYIALTTIALRTTQLSGPQLGTAFLRSAATFLNPATTKGQGGRAVLASLGIDPNANYTDLIVNALRRAAQLTPAQRQQLSLAVFGPLLGGRTAGFFTGGPQLLDTVMPGLSSQKVKGTFLEEFDRFLSTSRQELKALVNDVQQLGAALSQSGLLTPLALFVQGLDTGLHLSTELLHVWSQLPTFVKEAAGLAVGAFAVRAVTQRAGLSSGVPFFGQSQTNIDRTALTKGLEAEQQFYQQQYAASARGAATAGLQSQAAERQRNAAVIAGTEEQQIAAQRAFEATLQRQLQLEAERDVLADQTLALQERINAVQANLNRGMTAQAAAGAEGIAMQSANLPSSVAYRLNTLEQGRMVPNPVVATGLGAGPVGAGFVGASAYQQAGGAVGEPEIGAGPVGAGLQKMQQMAEQEAAATASGLARARSVVTGGLSKIGSGVQSLASGIVGAINPWIAGLLIAPFVIKAIEDGQKAIDDATKAAAQLPGGATNTPQNSLALDKVAMYVAQTDKYATGFSQFVISTQEAMDKGVVDVQNTIDKIGSQVQTSGQPFLQRRAISIGQGPLQEQVDDLNKKINANSGFLMGLSRAGAALVHDPLDALVNGPPTNRDITDPLKRQRAADESYMAAQQREFYTGQPTIFLPADTINQQTQAAFNNYKSGLISFGDMQREFDKSLKEIGLNPELTSGEAADIRSRVADLRARLQTRVKDIAAALAALSDAQLDKQITDYANVIKLFGTQSGEGHDALRHTQAILGELAGRAAFDPSGVIDKSGTTNLDKFAAGEQSITSAIQSQVQADLQTRLRVAKTTQQRSQAYQQAARDAQQEVAGVTQDIGKQAAYAARLEVTVAAERLAVKNFSAWGVGVADAIGGAIDTVNALNGFLGGVIGELDVLPKLSQTPPVQLQRDQGELKQHQDAEKFLKDFQKQENKTIHDTIDGYKGLADKASVGSSDPFEIARLQSELAQAQAKGDPVAVAQAQEKFAEQELRAAKKQKEKLQANIDLANAQYAYDQAVQDAAQSYYDVLAASAWDPIEQSAIEIQKAADALAHAHGTAATNAAQVSLINAQHKQQQAIEDRVQSQYDVLESATTDPVKLAAIELNKAQQKLDWTTTHGGVGSQSYNQALAGRNQAQQKLVDQQVSQRESDIEFNLTMQKISTEAAIQQYQALLGVSGITKQLRQQVLERIQALKNEGQSDFAALDLGTLRLPTPYEIRRAVLAAQAGVNVTQHYSTSIQVTDERSAAAVGVQMERYHTGTYKAVQRAMGTR